MYTNNRNKIERIDYNESERRKKREKEKKKRRKIK